MKTITSFQMVLLPVRKDSIGRSAYTVAVTIPNYELGDDIHFNGRTARDAFLEAMEFVNGYINLMCSDCALIVPEYDETFRNCGLCLPCWDKHQAAQ